MDARAHDDVARTRQLHHVVSRRSAGAAGQAGLLFSAHISGFTPIAPSQSHAPGRNTVPMAPRAPPRTISFMVNLYASPELADRIRALRAAVHTSGPAADSDSTSTVVFCRVVRPEPTVDTRQRAVTLESNLQIESAYTLPNGRSSEPLAVPGFAQSVGASPPPCLERLGRPRAIGIEVPRGGAEGGDRP